MARSFWGTAGMGDEAWRRDFRLLLEEVLDEKFHLAVDALRAEFRSGHHVNDHVNGDMIISTAPEAELTMEGDLCRNVSSENKKMSVAKNEQLKDYLQVKDLEEHYEGLYEVTRAFNLLCQKDRSTISATELVEMFVRHHQKGAHSLDPALVGMRDRFSNVILLLNAKTPSNEGRKSSLRVGIKPSDEISLDTFTMIMHRSKEVTALPSDEAEDVNEIREILLKEETFRKVAQCTNTTMAEIQGNISSRPKHVSKLGNKIEGYMQYLDPCIGVVILLNALVIVVSVDVERGAEMWTWFEVGFAIIFMAELLLRICLSGPVEFFLGFEMGWNIFDTVVVIASSIALLLTHLRLNAVGGDLTLMRLLRFMRLTKLVRVLKLKAFAELVMLVNGIVIGLRTLVWVVVFMLFLLIFIGVVLTDSLGQENANFGSCTAYPDENVCRHSERHLKEHSQALFGSLFRSMFTAFRCLTDGCSSVDGTPLMPYFHYTMGPLVIVAYMLVFIFVTFGLFNLIMAVFVENTLDGAKRLETKRKEAQRTEHVRLAQKLQQLIVMFCRGEGIPEEIQASSKFDRFREYFGTRKKRPPSFENEEIKDVHVTQDVFVDVCNRPEVQNLLAELEISVDNNRALFDVIDANNNGTLEVTELVQGLLRLRGAGDRTESVESLLAIKAMQRSLKAVEVLGLHQQELVQKLVHQKNGTATALTAMPIVHNTSAAAFAVTATNTATASC